MRLRKMVVASLLTPPFLNASQKHASVERQVDIAPVKSPYAQPNLSLVLGCSCGVSHYSGGPRATANHHLLLTCTSPSRQANRGETEVWSRSCFSQWL